LISYLLNPAGITLLVVFSGTIASWLAPDLVVVLVLLAGTFDRLTFGNLDHIAKYLDTSRPAVTEAVFVLLAVLAVELVLRGLTNLGIIGLVGHFASLANLRQTSGPRNARKGRKTRKVQELFAPFRGLRGPIGSRSQRTSQWPVLS
jgi:hypothetical protein